MTKTSKIIFFSIVMVLLLAIISQNYRKSKTANASIIKIAALLPLTGNSSSQGELIKQGLDLALEDIDQSKTKIQIIYEDTQADPKKAVSAYIDLKSREHI